MFDFHKDKQRYFNIQKEVTEEDVIPFLEKQIGSCINKRVLEVGCAEAGVLKAFLDKGNTGIGIELAESRFVLARQFLDEDIKQGKADIINKNIYDVKDPASELNGLFDIIILKDVIEHIHDQGKFIKQLRGFLAPDGVVFFAYPPWWMPFGGHQQICNAKLLRTLPWFQLLPKSLYKGLLQLFNERPATIADLLEIKETGINIEKMRRLLRENNYTILDQKFWLFNPIYKFKFGINKKVVWKPLTMLPYIRNFYTTAHYVVFCPKS